MNEGKFKKQLNKFPNKWEEEFRKIIDEARRDYPSMASLGLVPKLSEYDIKKIDDARVKWFIKWFGDSE